MIDGFKRKTKQASKKIEKAIADRLPDKSTLLVGNTTTEAEWEKDHKERKFQHKLTALLGAIALVLKLFGIDIGVDPDQQAGIAGLIAMGLGTYWAFNDMRHTKDAGFSRSPQ